MDIDEIKRRKLQLQTEILDLVTQFSRQTAVNVESVRIDHVDSVDGRRSYYVSVELTI